MNIKSRIVKLLKKLIKFSNQFIILKCCKCDNAFPHASEFAIIINKLVVNH